MSVFKLFSGLMVPPEMIADLKTNGGSAGTVVNTEALNKLRALLNGVNPNAERLLFEKLAKEVGHPCNRKADGEYDNVYLQAAWQGWQECVQAHNFNAVLAEIQLENEELKKRNALLESVCFDAKRSCTVALVRVKDAGHYTLATQLNELLGRMDRSGI